MGAMMDGWLAGVPWARILGLVIDVSIKTAVVVAGAGLAAALLRRSSAYARSMVWVFTLVALLALPFAQFVSPLWSLPVIPDVGAWFERGAETSAVVFPVDGAGRALDSAPDGSVEGAAPRAGGPAGWHVWLLAAWAAGTALSLLWLAARGALCRRILRRCEAVDGSWRDLLDEVCAKLGLRGCVRVFESREIDAAVTVGAINPAIVVPAGSSSWPNARRRYILAHELAHIKRRDGLVEVLVLVAKSVHWFNPFVWAAVRSLRVERERDCDDAVLRAGAKPSDYAMFLMDIAARLGARGKAAWQLSTISQGSNLKERIMSILDPTIDRNRGGRRAGIVSCLLLASIVVPLSISGIWETKAQEKCDKAKTEEAMKAKKEQALKEAELKKKLESADLTAEEKAALKGEAKVVKMKKEDWDKLSDEEKAKLKEEWQLKEKMSGASREEKIKLTWAKIESQDNSAAAQVHRAVMKKGPEAAAKIVQKIKAAGDDAYYFKEGEFNTLGYVYLFDKKVDEAIAVFKLNVEMNPESWNTYDSLGEAMLAAGKCEKARKLYEKSLALNPDNENGRRMLAQVEQCEKEGSYARAAKEGGK
jgi:beta-lactamase regulating signal transducer with metallopeptidase domain